MEQLYEGLPKETRRQLRDLPDVVHRLEADAQKMRHRFEELQEALDDVDTSPADPAIGVRHDRILADLTAERELVQKRLADAVAALETIRLNLLRLRAGTGSVQSLTTDLAYHYAPSTATVISPDMSVPDVPTQDHTITLSAEYVPIENLAIEAELPFLLVKYDGTMPHLPPGAWDDHNFHATLTDFRGGIRYQLLDQPYVALSPYVAVTIPVMSYEVNGFAVGGRQ